MVRGEKANESVLRKIYPNQNGELFNAFLNNRRESRTESGREFKKRCGPRRFGCRDRIEGQTREDVTYALASTSGIKVAVGVLIFHLPKRAPLIYFKSFFLYFTPPGTTLKLPWFPSGYLVGGLLLVNLIAAHLARFKFTWKKAGIMVLHSGVILLLLGQLFTSLFQVESQMRLDQGETKNYSLSYYHDELAVIDTSAPDFDQVISIPDSQLYKGHKIGLPADSLEVGIDEYFPNSALFPRISCRPRTIHIYRSVRWLYRSKQNEPTKRTNATCQLVVC